MFNKIAAFFTKYWTFRAPHIESKPESKLTIERAVAVKPRFVKVWFSDGSDRTVVMQPFIQENPVLHEGSVFFDLKVTNRGKRISWLGSSVTITVDRLLELPVK